MFILPKIDHIYRLKEVNKELLKTYDSQVREQIKTCMNLPAFNYQFPFLSRSMPKSDVRRFLICLNYNSLLGLFSRENLIKSRKAVGEEARSELSNVDLLNLPQACCKHLGHLSKAINRVKDLGIKFVTSCKNIHLKVLKLPPTYENENPIETLDWKIIRNFLSERAFSKYSAMKFQGATASCVARNKISN
ncbi:hypothetical protein HZS_2186, partial [Henneguya salminicola]